MGDARVSLTEIFEFRVDGLNVEELLAVLLASCEFLRERNGRNNTLAQVNGTQTKNTFNGVFSPDTIFLTRDGEIHIVPISLDQADDEFLPPEFRQSAAPTTESSVGDAQLVWCLGEVGARAAQPEIEDAAILSLLNLMTLDANLAANRPTLAKLAQMLRNKVKSVEVMRANLIKLYQELMGDIEDLIDDKFCDDIRFSSTRSSLSIVSGALRRRGSGSSAASTNASLRLRRDEIAKRMASAGFDITAYKDVLSKNDDGDDEDDNSTVVDESDVNNVGSGAKLKASGASSGDETETEERTPSTTPSASPKARRPIKNGDEIDSTKNFANQAAANWDLQKGIGRQALDQHFNFAQENLAYSDDSSENLAIHQNAPKSYKNVESVEVEVHAPRVNALDDYVALTNAQNMGNVISARKRSSQLQNEKRKSSLENFLHGMDKIEPYESCKMNVSPPVSLPDVVVNDSRGARMPVASNTGTENAAFQASPQIHARKNLPPSHYSPVANLPSKRTPAPKIPSSSEAVAAPSFSRQNSLQPSRIQRHGSARLNASRRQNQAAVGGGMRRTLSPNFAVPEFLEKSAMPLIRLRAHSMKRKKVSLYRHDDALVLIKLLTGQCVEVNCRTDTLVSNIFETVAAHLNITEHLFFGLALLKNSEYYFLDADRRLEKWAPSGWKSSVAARLRANSTSSSPLTHGQLLSAPGSGGGGGIQRSASNLASAAAGLNSATEYCLHLRFRYYPKKLEFVKTEPTMHNLYLQLRQDILDGVLRFNDVTDVACELAALALQAEFGTAPSTVAQKEAAVSEKPKVYFKIDNYLPTNFYATAEPNSSSSADELEAKICTWHAALSNLSRVEAERAFIARCQAALGYGAHYYRVSKIKPSSSRHVAYFNRLADIHRLAIMPLGIAICREQTTTGARHVQAAYEWHAIRTLQFDRKRVLISTVEGQGEIVVDHVFYTDHYSKSSYLVRFAASQHRFMMKMRHWQSTLNRVKGCSSSDFANSDASKTADYAIDVGVLELDGGSEKENFHFPKIQKPSVSGISEKWEQTNHHDDEPVSIPDDAQKYAPPQKVSDSNNSNGAHRYLPKQQNVGVNGEMPMHNGGGLLGNKNTAAPPSPAGMMREIDADYLRYCYGSEAQTLRVQLRKHPRTGLGLTLVDGAVNGVCGIYVKSVAEDGDGKRKGLNIGDCLLSVSGTSLFKKSRHDAVELVKACGEIVELEVLRFPSITEVLEAVVTTAAASNNLAANVNSTPLAGTVAKAAAKNCGDGGRSGTIFEQREARRRDGEERQALQRRYSFDRKKSSDNSPQRAQQNHAAQGELAAGKKNSSPATPNFRKYNKRAMSDFGAIGDTLPVLDSEDLIITTMDRKRMGRSSSDVSSTLSPSSSSSSVDTTVDEKSVAAEGGAARSPHTLRRGKYNLGTVTAMYDTFHNDEDDMNNEVDGGERRESADLRTLGAGRRHKIGAGNNSGNLRPMADFDTISWATTSFDTTTLRSYTSATKQTKQHKLQQKNQRKNTLDWTNDLSDIDDGENLSGGSSTRASLAHRTEVLKVEIRRAFAGQPLGFQIGSVASTAAGGSSNFMPPVRTGGEASATIFAVTQITAMPAAGANLKIGDVLLAINGTGIAGVAHERVVELLRANLHVVLEVERRRESNDSDDDADEERAKRTAQRQKVVKEREDTIEISLDKSQSRSIGLSLAKRMGHEGIFIRNIAPGSLADSPSIASAAVNGDEPPRLLVGDRIWAIDGENVANESSAEIVRRLTQIDGVFQICVKRITVIADSNR